MPGRSAPGSGSSASTARQAGLFTTESGSLLLTRDFGLIWSGQLISQIGDGISKLALFWFVYAITGSPLKTSVIGLLQTIPPIVLGPVIGVYVDRLPKKVLLIVSDLLRALLIGLIPCLIPVESFTVSVLYLLVLLHAIATAVFGPALTAAIPPWDEKNEGYLKYVREGGEIFFQNCHFCHGDNLNGRGLHAFAFNPIPANITDPGTIAQLQETFIFWRVAKGGIGLPNEGFPWASVMPPWEQHLTVDEIWKVILFEYWHTGYYPRTWD